jgi:hypothetical protein
MLEGKIVDALKNARIAWAESALLQPPGRDGFAYGYASGMYAGYTEALGVIENVLRERDDQERADD